ncbi:proline dehydrogenase family protein [Paenibacillus cremeus]|uniref:proline dehydrogenase n=1 Tax=Paenibacillus cremeus TaxID=2163881 RepID=A0A559K3P0_9BACL|nr:proline dehydrogenase family protein [Paenibacillus cremeus]TVY06726.1 proline dehydrogenase [Paenibacillus cremeus]
MDLGTKLFRSVLLTMAGNRAVAAVAQRYGLKLGARRFVAGETLEEVMMEVAKLNRKGISATIDHLGEGIRSMTEAEAFKQEYLKLLDCIQEHKVEAGISLKPTQMGLSLDPDAGFTHIRDIVQRARKHQVFVCIDMENSPYTDSTIGIVQKLHKEGLRNVGTVIQAYLHRSLDDVNQLTNKAVVLRLVKGAYKEPNNIAFRLKRDVDENLKQLIAARLDSGVYTAIASHDAAIIDWTCTYASERRISRQAFEFQMLYGVASPLQERLAKQGYKVRCYVPYGRKWYPYFVRRLAERPANVMFILKNWRVRKKS